ncbi:MAG: TonB-dependent receptor [Pseudomonadota bacterium]
MKTSLSRWLAATTVAGAVGTPALAQNPLEEVIVTAQKREQSAQDVPLSITAYGSDFLDDVGIEGFERLSAFVPGLVVQEQSANNPAFVIRGITSDSGSAQQQARVSVYQDGIDISRSRGAVVELFDINRVEVVKGPQATLFGSAASVGAISVISNKPTDEFEGNLRIGVGNYDELKFSGAVSGALLGDKLRGRLAFVSNERDGYIENIDGSSRSQRPGGPGAEDLQGKDTQSVRLILDSRPVDELLIEFIAQYQEDTPPGTAFKSAILSPTVGDTDPWTDAELGPTGSRRSDFLDGRLGLEREVESYTLTAVWDVNDVWSVTGIGNYREFDSYEIFDADGSWSNLFQAAEDAEGDQWSLELRANFDNGDRWLGFIGASVFEEDGFQRAPSEGDQAVLSAIAFGCILDDCDADEARALLQTPESGQQFEAEFTNFGETTAYSVYADVTYQATDRLAATLGGRYVINERKSGYASTSNFFIAQINFGETGNEVIESDTEDFDAFLPRLVLDYDATDSTKVYFNLGRGHSPEVVEVGPDPNASGLGAPDIVTTIIPEETVDSAELGFKSELMDGSLFLEGSIFYQLYNDFQTSIVDDLQTRTVTVDEATMQGIEFAVNFAPNESWFTFFNVALIDAELENDDLDDDTVNFDGNKFRLQPETSISAGVRYSFEALAGFMDLGLYGDYRSSVFFEEDNAPASGVDIEQDGYDLWSIRAGWLSQDERFQVRLYVNNLFDEEYTIDGGNTGADLGSPTFIAGPPRLYGGDVAWYF